MDNKELILYLVKVVCYVVVAFVIPYVASFFKKKTENEHVKDLIDRASDTVIDCVLTVNQVYVEALKKEGKFDKDAQAEAFVMCTNYILNRLNEETIAAINNVYGDLDNWIKTTVEANVVLAKFE